MLDDYKKVYLDNSEIKLLITLIDQEESLEDKSILDGIRKLCLSQIKNRLESILTEEVKDNV